MVDNLGRHKLPRGVGVRSMTASQRDLATMDRHIAEAEEEIRRQRELVEKLCMSGRNTIAEEAEQLLSKMIDALEEMKEHRRVIIENSQRSKG